MREIAGPGADQSVAVADVDNAEPDETTGLLESHDTKNKSEAAAATHCRDISLTRFRWLLACIFSASLLSFFDSTLMASSHPVITSYFNASNSASWLSTAFLLASTVCQPLYGRVSDVTGRRPLFLFAIALFFLGTAWCAAAQSIGSFIAARAVCGVGAGGCLTMTVIIISDVVHLEYRGIYQAYYNVVWGCGNGLGAALGGLMCDSLGWRAAFGVQLPFIFVVGLMATFSTPPMLGPSLAKSGDKDLLDVLKEFDTPGALALTATVTCLILGINLGGNVYSWDHPMVVSSLALFGVSACILIAVERRGISRPILPLSFLGSFPVANLMWSNFLSAIICNTILFNVPLFLQAVRRASPTASGLYLIAPLVAASAMGVFSGFCITWTRKMKPLLVVGAFFFLLGSIGVTCLDAGSPSWAMLLLLPGVSIGQGLNWPATSIATLALNAQEQQAVVSTTLGLLRYIGLILGVALSSWIFQNALVVFLEQSVTAPTASAKAEIIRIVRESVAAIPTLDPGNRAEVVGAYASALRLVFASSILFSIPVVLLNLPMKLPDLQRKAPSGKEASPKEGQSTPTGTTEDRSAVEGANTDV